MIDRIEVLRPDGTTRVLRGVVDLTISSSPAPHRLASGQADGEPGEVFDLTFRYLRRDWFRRLLDQDGPTEITLRIRKGDGVCEDYTGLVVSATACGAWMDRRRYHIQGHEVTLRSLP